ncbi:MAG: polymer-forming cytoskeletal protein [Proteobacteria bacterium]|nr:polymer-forming cytoskeletal protein [Pseudomonadota bacterium]
MFSKSKTPRPEANQVPVPPLPDLKAPQPQQAHMQGQVAAQPQQRAPLPGKAPSMLASDLTFEGNITGAGDLHIDGTVRGDVKVGRLTVGETGNVEGNVQAEYVEVRGRVVGGVNGKQVKLMSTAYVDGDISHEQLSIDVGAYFQGRCLQGRKVAEAAPQHAPQQQAGYSTPVYSQPAPAPAPAVDTGQLIELKPAG